MAIRLTDGQFAAANRIAEDAWFADLKSALFGHHRHLDPAIGERLFAACRVECQRLGVQSEAALHAFFDMSFALGDLVSAQPAYQELHPVFLREHGTADRLPIYLYEKID
jgi:hypothetical protein